jgi:hypothetical protein
MALVVQQVVTFTASLAALWLVCPWRPTFAIFWTSGREILRFMFHTTPGGLIGMINQSCDTMLVAYFFGPASTGIYSVGKRLRLSLQLVPGAPINGIITPTSRGSVTLPNRSHHKSSARPAHATATTLRHVCSADALKARCILAEVRWHWTLNV